MAQIEVEGRINSNIELRHSVNGTPYVRFELVEYAGNRRNPAQSFHVCAFGETAIRLVTTGVQVGDRIQVRGTLELEVFGTRNGKADKRMKIMLREWETFPVDATANTPNP